MNKLPLDIIEFIAQSNIPVYHLLINSIPRLVNKQGLHKRAVDHFTIKIITANNEYWFLNRLKHREDGPAVIWSNGACFWGLYGKLHREDGPAVIYSDGREEFWLNGKEQKRTIYMYFILYLCILYFFF